MDEHSADAAVVVGSDALEERLVRGQEARSVRSNPYVDVAVGRVVLESTQGEVPGIHSIVPFAQLEPYPGFLM